MVGSRAAAHLDRGRPDWTVMDRAWEAARSAVQRLSARVDTAPLVSRGCRAKKVNVTQEVCVGGGVAAPLFSYFPSHYLCLRTLDQVLTNRSGPRGAAPAGLS